MAPYLLSDLTPSAWLHPITNPVSPFFYKVSRHIHRLLPVLEQEGDGLCAASPGCRPSLFRLSGD